LFKGKIERAETPGATDTIESPESPSSHRLWQTVFAIEMLGDRNRDITADGKPAITHEASVIFDADDDSLASYTLGYYFQPGDNQFDKGEYWPELTIECVDRTTGQTTDRGKYMLVDETRAMLIHDPDDLENSYTEEPSTELHYEMHEILKEMRDEMLKQSDTAD
jgi:hypothetical protein